MLSITSKTFCTCSLCSFAIAEIFEIAFTTASVACIVSAAPAFCCSAASRICATMEADSSTPESISEKARPASLISSTPFSILSVMSCMWSFIVFAFFAEVFARLLTSFATTAKPVP